MMISHREAQELHELIGAAIEAQDYRGLQRAREIASLIVCDTEPRAVDNYRVSLHEEPGDRLTLFFDCMAEDADHAAEQAEDAYPGCEVTNVTLNELSRL